MRPLLFLLCSMFCVNTSAASVYQDANGNTHVFEGRWLVVNYWAGWCIPCRHEIPAFNRLDKQLQDKGAAVLGINYDRLDDADLLRTTEALDITFPVLTNRSAQQLDFPFPIGLPTTYIINPDGKIMSTLVGAQTEESILSVLASHQI